MEVLLVMFSDSARAKGSFIKSELFKNGKRSNVYLKKDKGSFLCMQLHFLIQKGLELDMAELKKKYPEQKTWHIR